MPLQELGARARSWSARFDDHRGGADVRQASVAARRGRGRALGLGLVGGVGVVEVGLEHAVLDQRLRRVAQPFAVEGAAAEAARVEPVVVDAQSQPGATARPSLSRRKLALLRTQLAVERRRGCRRRSEAATAAARRPPAPWRSGPSWRPACAPPARRPCGRPPPATAAPPGSAGSPTQLADLQLAVVACADRRAVEHHVAAAVRSPRRPRSRRRPPRRRRRRRRRSRRSSRCAGRRARPTRSMVLAASIFHSVDSSTTSGSRSPLVAVATRRARAGVGSTVGGIGRRGLRPAPAPARPASSRLYGAQVAAVGEAQPPVGDHPQPEAARGGLGEILHLAVAHAHRRLAAHLEPGVGLRRAGLRARARPPSAASLCFHRCASTAVPPTVTLIDAHRGQAHAHRHHLAVLAAGADAGIEASGSLPDHGSRA